MVAKLVDYIKTYDDVADPELCSNIIKTFEYEEHNQSPVDREGRPTFTEMNISKQYSCSNTVQRLSLIHI